MNNFTSKVLLIFIASFVGGNIEFLLKGNLTDGSSAFLFVFCLLMFMLIFTPIRKEDN